MHGGYRRRNLQVMLDVEGTPQTSTLPIPRSVREGHSKQFVRVAWYRVVVLIRIARNFECQRKSDMRERAIGMHGCQMEE